MQTILTGTPGNGKTAHALDLCFFDKTSIWFGLEKYVDGIADLKLPHFEFPDVKLLKSPSFVPLSRVDSDEYAVWLPDNPLYSEFVEARALAKTSFDLWFLWATPDSVLLVDEAQRYLRPRPSGAPVPLCIKMIEYHRHFGIHLFFITQKERLLHSNVRMLAGQHIHLTDSWRGRHRFEWPECKDSDSKAEKSVSAHASYKLPAHVFPFYKSTVSVLKTGHKTPMFVYGMLAAALAIPVAGYYAFSLMSHKKAVSAPVVSASGTVSAASSVPEIASESLNPFSDQFVPAIAGRPETAPAFDSLRKIVVMPLISACVQSSTACKCYTQQGTRIADMTPESCADYLSTGAHFNPYGGTSGGVAHALPDAFKHDTIAAAGGGSENLYSFDNPPSVPSMR